MSEHTPPPLPPGDPYQPPAGNAPPPADDGNEGSVGAGIAICLALMLLGGPALGVVLRLLMSLLSAAGINLYSLMWLPIGLGPILLPVIAGIWFTRKGLRKTAKGVWLGFAIAIGLVLLLVAACFGILAGNGLNIH
ncbi:hypothetical protein [Solilutibacter silvestris]|uniref:hypothetical protein n=1 Tax=Solilutibacter silvestris TaxID=1645665 RepID=UPI003D357F87